MSLSGVNIGTILASLKEFESALSVSTVLNNLRSIGCSYFLIVWQHAAENPPGPVFSKRKRK